MGSHSIYDMNKGLGKINVWYPLLPWWPPLWKANWFQFVDRMICNWVSEKCGVHHILTETTHFSFCLVFGLQSNMAKTWENLLMLFTVLKPLALANKEECCSAPKMSSLVSMKCLITWPHRTKAEAVLDALCITVCLQWKILHFSFKCSART